MTTLRWPVVRSQKVNFIAKTFHGTASSIAEELVYHDLICMQGFVGVWNSETTSKVRQFIPGIN